MVIIPLWNNVSLVGSVSANFRPCLYLENNSLCLENNLPPWLFLQTKAPSDSQVRLADWPVPDILVPSQDSDFLQIAFLWNLVASHAQMIRLRCLAIAKGRGALGLHTTHARTLLPVLPVVRNGHDFLQEASISGVRSAGLLLRMRLLLRLLSLLLRLLPLLLRLWLLRLRLGLLPLLLRLLLLRLRLRLLPLRLRLLPLLNFAFAPSAAVPLLLRLLPWLFRRFVKVLTRSACGEEDSSSASPSLAQEIH